MRNRLLLICCIGVSFTTYATTLETHKKSCDQGAANACIQLGVIYADGSGVERDNQKALALFSKACEMGDAVGCRYHKVLDKLLIKEAEKKAEKEQEAKGIKDKRY